MKILAHPVISEKCQSIKWGYCIPKFSSISKTAFSVFFLKLFPFIITAFQFSEISAPNKICHRTELKAELL